jgi:hypothetical protein
MSDHCERVACGKCGEPIPGCNDFDVTYIFRCPNCDALYENGKFICFGVPSAPAPSAMALVADLKRLFHSLELTDADADRLAAEAISHHINAAMPKPSATAAEPTMAELRDALKKAGFSGIARETIITTIAPLVSRTVNAAVGAARVEEAQKWFQYFDPNDEARWGDARITALEREGDTKEN